MQAFNSEPIQATINKKKSYLNQKVLCKCFLCKHLSVQPHNESIKINIVEIFTYYSQYAYCIKSKCSILAFFSEHTRSPRFQRLKCVQAELARFIQHWFEDLYSAPSWSQSSSPEPAVHRGAFDKWSPLGLAAQNKASSDRSVLISFSQGLGDLLLNIHTLFNVGRVSTFT